MTILTFSTVIFATHFLGTLTGFGCTILAMPFVIALVGLELAKPVLLLLGFMQTAALAVSVGSSIDWRGLRAILLITILGLPFGFVLYEYLPQRETLIFLGILMIAAAVLGFAQLKGFSFHVVPEGVLRVFLFLGGVIQGAFVSGGPLVVLYATRKYPQKNVFRATLALMWTVLNAIIIAQSAAMGNITPEVWKYTMLAVPALALSVVLGNYAADRVSKTFFQIFLYAVLAVSGMLMIINQVFP